jgi:ATPase subunit of ABC transporter with duplicated ATPase domains
VGFLEAIDLLHVLPDGRRLFADASIRVAAGQVVALIGDNGAGKTTLLRMLTGDLVPGEGSIRVQGGLTIMPQFVGAIRDSRTVRDLLVAVSPAALRRATAEVDSAELAMMHADDEPTQLRYAHALHDWGEAGGYQAEVLWDTVTTAALGAPYDRAKHRALSTLSGGEQKRLALEALLRGPEQVLLLDEPDNYLDVPGKRWLEEQLRATGKAVLLVSHDRELLANCADAVITVEGGSTWTHGGGFRTWPAARKARWDRLAQLGRRWAEDHQRLRDLVRTLRQQASVSDDLASRYHAAQTRLRRFEAAGRPPEPPKLITLRPRLHGGRTGVRVLTCENLELTGLMRPFDLELFLGDRLCVAGPNGSGKSHFLRLLAELAGPPDPGDGDTGAEPRVAFTGECRLGARVRPGLFAQTHAHPEWQGHSPVDILWHGQDERAGVDRGTAMSALARYGLAKAGDQPFETLSGGQQARLQVLLLELSGATLLLLDEPTDNLDLGSAEALQSALDEFTGTVIAVTHDRWFARGFDRFLMFGEDGTVAETMEPRWDEARVQRVH